MQTDYNDPEFPNDDPDADEPRTGDAVNASTVVNYGGQWVPTDYDRRTNALNQAVEYAVARVKSSNGSTSAEDIVKSAETFYAFLKE